MYAYSGINSEHLCYVHCNNCTTVLAVSVPYKSLFDMVSVKCGNCTGIIWVNLKSMELQPPLPYTLGQIFTSTSNTYIFSNEESSPSYESANDEVTSSYSGRKPESTMKSYTGKEITNQNASTSSLLAPGKRNRAPSTYNHFIKEEIQRIKANNPDITHRQAFSTAAKNWALFPHIRS
ncbi:protein YABBY 4 isoform X2 [Cryptomeria japonica]|uniref:protein YABBY 4 isoform X2 n=1 Tax=Cryptomeria japonica TaxID=3369 RepID=UPI0027DA4350|nr:protein YABBY 4 isoform X2 [Cryptomeria japonica]XP_057824089.2 protein YABBY 4 isoform X2 [Cryptomeria japonica]